MIEYPKYLELIFLICESIAVLVIDSKFVVTYKKIGLENLAYAQYHVLKKFHGMHNDTQLA